LMASFHRAKHGVTRVPVMAIHTAFVRFRGVASMRSVPQTTEVVAGAP
jgi:hypothetical protein